MANHKSALKKVRQDTERRLRNRTHRSKLRTAIKRFRAAIEQGDKGTAGELLSPTLSLVDHSAKVGVLHGKAAARTKSRLHKAYNRIAS